jgi:hypothetical protein
MFLWTSANCLVPGNRQRTKELLTRFGQNRSSLKEISDCLDLKRKGCFYLDNEKRLEETVNIVWTRMSFIQTMRCVQNYRIFGQKYLHLPR